MSLDAFFSNPGSITQAEMARQLGVSRKTVHAWAKGYNQVPGTMAVKIIEITGGQVTYEGLYGTPAIAPDTPDAPTPATQEDQVNG